MPKSVSDQVVFVVGASTGIGRATALALASRGARVVCAARGAPALNTLVEEITRSGGVAVAVPTDVADPAAVKSLAGAAEERFGRIDTWVNNAAIGVYGRIEDITDEEFDRVLRVNFLGHVHGVHAALPAVRRAGGGVIIGVASAEGIRAVPFHAPYTASKWALRGFYDSLRIELALERVPIAVSTILPASIDTPFFAHARTKFDAMPKPPPPVYAPEVVAESIVYAAGRPRREIPVGGSAVSFYLAQRLSPALADALMSVRGLGLDLQLANRPDNRMDNVDAPIAERGTVSGGYRGRVLRQSAFTRFIGRRRRPGEFVMAARATRRRNGRNRAVRPSGPSPDPGGAAEAS
jgi:NAD(P)-dependent dehydrogenase (short-subunit alcohol dehydrogenase family)